MCYVYLYFKGKIVPVQHDMYEKYKRYVMLCSADHCGAATTKHHVSNLKWAEGIIGKGGIKRQRHL